MVRLAGVDEWGVWGGGPLGPMDKKHISGGGRMPYNHEAKGATFFWNRPVLLCPDQG